jgi:hypothetical protein
MGAPVCLSYTRRHTALAPGAEEIALTIEDDHRVFAAIEHKDIVVSINTDAADPVERPAGNFSQSALTRHLNGPLPTIIECPLRVQRFDMPASRSGQQTARITGRHQPLHHHPRPHP